MYLLFYTSKLKPINIIFDQCPMKMEFNVSEKVSTQISLSSSRRLICAFFFFFLSLNFLHVKRPVHLLIYLLFIEKQYGPFIDNEVMTCSLENITKKHENNFSLE